MTDRTEYHLYARPDRTIPPPDPVEFLTVQAFLADEPACRSLWDLVASEFRTRGKFLAVWPAVRFVALNRDPAGEIDGLLLVSAAIHWQVDYVVVRPDRRGRGIATRLVRTALDEARRRKVPYVMLTAALPLLPLYRACGFVPIGPD